MNIHVIYYISSYVFIQYQFNVSYQQLVYKGNKINNLDNSHATNITRKPLKLKPLRQQFDQVSLRVFLFPPKGSLVVYDSFIRNRTTLVTPRRAGSGRSTRRVRRSTRFTYRRTTFAGLQSATHLELSHIGSLHVVAARSRSVRELGTMAEVRMASPL